MTLDELNKLVSGNAITGWLDILGSLPEPEEEFATILFRRLFKSKMSAWWMIAGRHRFASAKLCKRYRAFYAETDEEYGILHMEEPCDAESFAFAHPTLKQSLTAWWFLDGPGAEEAP